MSDVITYPLMQELFALKKVRLTQRSIAKIS